MQAEHNAGTEILHKSLLAFTQLLSWWLFCLLRCYLSALTYFNLCSLCGNLIDYVKDVLWFFLEFSCTTSEWRKGKKATMIWWRLWWQGCFLSFRAWLGFREIQKNTSWQKVSLCLVKGTLMYTLFQRSEETKPPEERMWFCVTCEKKAGSKGRRIFQARAFECNWRLLFQTK